MAHRRIPLADLKVGMYVIGIDRSWLLTPFVSHKFKIRGIQDIENLKRSGISVVTIDTEEGVDPDSFVPADPPSGSSNNVQGGHATGSDTAVSSPLPAEPLSAAGLADNLALAKQRRTSGWGA